MLTALDNLLRRILVDGVPGLAFNGQVLEGQVTFGAPDEDWRTTPPMGTPRPQLSVFLFDVRENVRLRSNEMIERQQGTTVVARRMPYRLDCHYVISAFVPDNPGANPPDPPNAHTLLYEATGALARSQPLIPARVYPPGSTALNEWLPDYRELELPMIVNPHEGFPKLAEFWGTLAGAHPWEPVVYVVVTVPVDRRDAAASEIVRRRTTVYRNGALADTLVEIGGTVSDRWQQPVGRAWVIASDVSGELARTTSGDDGRFIIQLPPGATSLSAAAFSYGTTAPLAIDASTSEFNLRFT